MKPNEHGVLSQRDHDKAAKELNENPKTRAKSIEGLRKAITDYPGLTCPSDDKFLLKFLRARKFDEYRALQLIKQYYRNRNTFPEIFENFRPSYSKEIADTEWHNLLPVKDEKGQYVIWIRMGLFDPQKFCFEDIFKFDVMGMEMVIDNEDAQINGVTFICDMQDFGIAKAMQLMSASNMKRVFAIIQEGMPMRLKGIHHVNEPLVIGYTWPIMKQFLKAKIVERVFFHGTDMTNLHKHFPPEMLPPELGGKVTNMNEVREKWRKKFHGMEKKFLEAEKYGLVEDTPGMKGQAMKGEAMQVMSGTFRKLNID